MNHRNLSLTDIQGRLIPTATMVKGTAGTLGFEEGMYGILYQVVQKTDELALRGVPIYCVYNTESSTVKPSQLRNNMAIFPTREGVLSLLTFLNLKTLITYLIK